jgi:DNA processing protein
VTEHPFGAPVTPPNFARRNRIISGLSQAVLVAQAPRGSGALITARHALEQNRELLACPGPSGDPAWEGNFDLLREGSALCADPIDLLHVLGWAEDPGRADDESSSPVVRLLRCGDKTAEEMSLHLRIPVSRLQGELVLLEMAGSIRRAGSGLFTVRS